MCNVTKKQIVEQITLKTNFKASVVKTVTQEVLNTIMAELEKGHRIELRDFGIFEPVYRSAKMAQNPRTLCPVPVDERYTVRFKPGKKMQEHVGEGKWAREQLKLRAQIIKTPTSEVVTRSGSLTSSTTKEESPIVETTIRGSEFPNLS